MGRKPLFQRSRKINRWVLARQFTQGLALLGLIISLVATGINRAPFSLMNLPIRLSPLAMLASMISSRTFLMGMTVSLILLLSSLVVGKAWCGWLCPVGTVLDIFKFRHHKSKIRVPERMRTVKYGFLLTILLAAVFTNLTLLLFDPLTLFTRTMTLSIFPAMDRIILETEKLLISIPFLAEPVYRFDLLIRPAVFPLEPIVYKYAVLTGLFFISIILFNLIAERFWCRYICPLGGLLGIFSKIALFKRRVQEDCAGCGLCESHCPTDTINPVQNYSSDPSECTMCMNCLGSCHKDSVKFSPRLDISTRKEYDPGRRFFLNSLFSAAVLSVLSSLDWVKKFPKNYHLQPPGVLGDSFSATCIRCGLCMKICPTSGLQVDLEQTGFDEVGTPVLVPRLGFCQYSCNACGQVCPVGAIPRLALEEKQRSVIGVAYIDQNRCIAWGDHENCIVCEEMCPLPQKAITLETGTFVRPDGRTITIPLPVVNRNTCIGCGTCENKCPVSGDAAIRVFTL